MKKLLSILTAAVLLIGVPCIENADAADAKRYTIQEVFGQAADGWHKTYEAHGRTIVVDIPVQVPDADTFPALKAIPMPCLDSIPTSSTGYNQGENKFFNETGFFRWDSLAGEIKTELAKKSKIKNPPRGMDVKSIVYLFNQLDPDTAYAFNNPATVRDADTLMKTTWETYCPDEKIELMPHWVYAYGEMRYYDAVTGSYTGDPWPDFMAPQLVYFDQVLRGIPLLGYAMNSFYNYAGSAGKENRGYVGGVAITQGLLDIGREDLFLSMQYSLLKEEQVLEEDLPLCGLEKAIGTYEQLIVEGRLRSVKSLRLGYVVWYNKGEPESFTLLPTWVLEGEQFKDAKTESRRTTPQSNDNPPEYGPLMVNAQTGEFLSPYNTSANRSYNKPDTLPWE